VFRDKFGITDYSVLGVFWVSFRLNFFLLLAAHLARLSSAFMP